MTFACPTPYLSLSLSFLILIFPCVLSHKVLRKWQNINTISPVVLHHGHAEAGEHCARRQLGRHLLYEVVVWGLARAQGVEHLAVETSLFQLNFKNFLVNIDCV